MPRKSLAKQRREELLDAFERCIVKYGLEGTSLEQVATEADMTRSIIRHYIGNRDKLVEALIERIIRQYTEQLIAEFEGITPEQSIQYSLDSMFSEQETMSSRDKIIIDVLMAAKDRYPAAKKMLIQMFEALVKSFADDLRKVYKKASKEQCLQVSYAIICMSEMHESFMWLGMKKQYHQDARAMADTLLKTLE